MNLSVPLFPVAWHWGMVLLSAVVLWRAGRRAPWHRLKSPTQLNLMLGLAVGLMLFWSLRIGVKPGLDLHMLGAMAVTLALGPQLALFALGITLTGVMLNGAIEWAAWPVNFILMVVVPVYIAAFVQRCVERWLPAHFFIFIFITGFFGAALVVMAQGLVVCLAVLSGGAYAADFLFYDYLPSFLLLGFAEAWISGAAVTLMVIYRPDWVAAFDDRRYLLNK